MALETGGYFDVFVVCGFAFDTLADEATGKAVADSVIAHSSVRLSTVGRILSAGFVIRSAGRYPHCTVELDPSAPFETGQRLASVFDPPIRNPRPGRT